jgi:hypothetical protein
MTGECGIMANRSNEGVFPNQHFKVGLGNVNAEIAASNRFRG